MVLNNALLLFTALEAKAKYVKLNHKQNGVELFAEKKEGSFVQINESSALEVRDIKLKHGDYYDYHYLSIAAELVLLEEEARGNMKMRDFTATLLTRLDFFLYNKECELIAL